MQFAFSYFYYIVNQGIERTVAEMFDDFDTDGSGYDNRNHLTTWIQFTQNKKKT